MTNLLEQQYQLIKEVREVVFQYLEFEVKQDLVKAVDSFNNRSIAYLMTHVANTYIAWAGNFALSMQKSYYTETDGETVAELRLIFKEVDLTMEQFISRFSEKPFTPVKGYRWVDKYIETDAYSIFTHVLTHEFHHKGQSMTMSRLLGHIPPDTDILRF
ncbi:DinB family protein [Pedobacter nyackensis]|uniref:Uncharacterized damage-inducible protein DinB (Forms a four-helix bundle) n=1 Tax=Pedobacter nyackensis TaxID=475255 RepID=A0A1W2DTZ9_9SPHI|nr:DinB family protein [Pedobacter nyackensis]SMD00508.1 Uncharacterized damage-inducible protein DinB (forms a four-helix bundle) [Pedobacter nyackensis]